VEKAQPVATQPAEMGAATMQWAPAGAATMQSAPTGAPTTLLAIEATNIPAAAVWPIRSRLRDDLLYHLVRG